MGARLTRQQRQAGPAASRISSSSGRGRHADERLEQNCGAATVSVRRQRLESAARSARGGKHGGSSPPRPPRPPLGHPDPPEDDAGGDGANDGYDDIEILGRDASYDRDDWRVVMDQMRLTPGSTNVYGYYFEFESRTTGILYVTFLADYRGVKTSGPGTTYAYYTVPARKYHQFQESATASAGNAVWDFLRIRGTIWGYQPDPIPRRLRPAKSN